MAGVAGKDDRAAPIECVPFEVRPEKLSAIETDTAELGFTMASDTETGALLRTLAASKPSGDVLKLGTGTGLATAWLLAGMDAASTLASVDTDPAVVDVARRHLEADSRVTFYVVDGPLRTPATFAAAGRKKRRAPATGIETVGCLVEGRRPETAARHRVAPVWDRFTVGAEPYHSVAGAKH